MSKHTSHIYEFGEFRLEPSERLLRRAGKVVPLPPKAFDLLLVLIQESGHLMTKEELLQRVWEGDVVEEANLSQKLDLYSYLSACIGFTLVARRAGT